jgi:hypothetical protein
MSPSKRTWLALLFSFLLSLPLFAQTDPSETLTSLEQTARTSVTDIARLRIEKWKTDGGTKKNAQSDSESIERNMGSALPELIGKVRSAPNDLNANFKLYRNLDVLYDVFSRFAETAGAFGSKEEFQSLAKDLDGLDAARRALADRMDALTASTQNELAQYRNQVKAAQSSAAAAPPKKIVIDDSEPDKKTSTKKKKPAAKPADPAAANSSNSGSSTPK